MNPQISVLDISSFCADCMVSSNLFSFVASAKLVHFLESTKSQFNSTTSGGGGCALGEKLVAEYADEFIVVVDERKKSQTLGEKVSRASKLILVETRNSIGSNFHLGSLRHASTLATPSPFELCCARGEWKQSRTVHQRLWQLDIGF